MSRYIHSILENAFWAGLPESWESDIAHAARIIHADVPLSRLYSLARYLFLHEDYDAKLFRYWPDPDAAMGRFAPLFFLLLSLDCVGMVRRLHAETAIPEHITRCTCRGIGTKAYDYFFFHGRPGTMKWALWWFRHHVRGELYRVGRLEFMVKQLHESLFLEDDKLTCHQPESSTSPETATKPTQPADGIEPAKPTQPADGIEPAKPTQPADGIIIPVDLSPGDYVLDIHIPGGGGLTLERVHDSLSDGLDFFDHLHPDKKIKGFESVSWIFSPDLEAVFPPEANLIRFRDKAHLFPVQSRKVEGLNFIFGTFSEDPADWPEKTTVQRRLKQHIIAGGKFRMSGMLLSRGELSGF